MKPKWMAFLPFPSFSYSLWVWQTFLPPKFSKLLMDRVCVCLCGWGWCWRRYALYCVFRKGYDTLFIILQEFSCCLILFCEADDKFRCPLPGSDFLLCYFRELAWPKDAQDCCPFRCIKALPWAQHPAENGMTVHPDFQTFILLISDSLYLSRQW